MTAVYERKVVVFDDFAYSCSFFDCGEVNNGYGCDHPDQEETDLDSNSTVKGKCYCHSCPLGIEPDEEDLDNPKVDWDGLCEEREVCEGEYLMIEKGDSATEEQRKALVSYERYLNRYNYSTNTRRI